MKRSRCSIPKRRQRNRARSRLLTIRWVCRLRSPSVCATRPNRWRRVGAHACERFALDLPRRLRHAWTVSLKIFSLALSCTLVVGASPALGQSPSPAVSASPSLQAELDARTAASPGSGLIVATIDPGGVTLYDPSARSALAFRNRFGDEDVHRDDPRDDGSRR